MNLQNDTGRPSTLPQLLRYSEGRFPDVRAIFAPHEKPIVEMTYAQLAADVFALGAGLIGIGVEPGQHVALFSDNRPAWLISDLAITGLGAVDVPRGSDTATAEFEFILEHSECRGAFVQDRKLYDRLASSPVFQRLQFVVLMDDSEPKGTEGGPKVFTIAGLIEAGRDHVEKFHEAAKNVTPDSMATIVYTSGTTGSPKGVVLTHGNLMTQPLGVELGEAPSPGGIQISILPAWHAYERAAEYYGMFHGTTITYSDKRYIRQDFIKLSPHLLPCVPRIWESVYQGIHSKLASAPAGKQRLFNFFMAAGGSYVMARRVALNRELSRKPLSQAKRALASLKMAALYPVYKLGDMLVFSKLRGVTGGRLVAALSGGGSLAPYLDDFFEIVGIPILNGYGLTETSPVICVRTLDRNVRGSVGAPMVGTEISLRDENGAEVERGQNGGIWCRGPQIMKEYYKNPEATSKVLTKDGWFISGDIGWVTPGGDLVITGRAKDTIVLSSGENVEPEPIEDASRKSKLVQQIVLVGQDQKSLGALVVPEYGILAETLGISLETDAAEIIKHPDATKVMKRAIAEAMQADGRFKASESVSKICLLAEPFSESNGMMTNTMKIKKNVVYERYRDEIAEMFAK